MNELEMQQELNDIAMRAALWEWLQKQRPDNKRINMGPDAPKDEFVRADLRRILFPKRRLWGWL
jgi:hypothetical protein